MSGHALAKCPVTIYRNSRSRWAEIRIEPKYQKSQDEDHRALAFEKIFEEVMLIRRRQDLELYRLVASDAVLKSSLQQSMRGMLR